MHNFFRHEFEIVCVVETFASLFREELFHITYVPIHGLNIFHQNWKYFEVLYPKGLQEKGWEAAEQGIEEWMLTNCPIYAAYSLPTK